MSDCRHVVVGPVHARWKRPKSAEGTLTKGVQTKFVFDPYHYEVILLRGSPTKRIFVSDKTTRQWKEYPLKLPKPCSVEGAKLSPEKNFFALRVSDKEVKILDAVKGELITARSCRASKARMEEVHWMKGDLLLFVTNFGVELYALVKDKLKHVKTAAYSIVYHWFASFGDEHVLVVVDANCIFQAYSVTSKSIVRFSKFMLECGGTSYLPPPPGATFSRHQISLWQLYGRLVCVFVNEKKGQLHLLSPSNETMEQTHSFELSLPATYGVSVLDNVLILHNTNAKVSLLFDTKSSPKEALAPPLPLGLVSDESGEDVVTFEAPCFVLEAKPDFSSGVMWWLALQLDNIVLSWPAAQRGRLVEFLLKRNSMQAKIILMQLVKTILTTNGNLLLLSRVFSIINKYLSERDVAPPPTANAPLISSSSFNTSFSATSSLLVASSSFKDGKALLAEKDDGMPDTSAMSPGGRGASDSIILPSSRGDSVVVPQYFASSSLRSLGGLGDEKVEVENDVPPDRTASGYLVVSQWDMLNSVFVPAKEEGCSARLLIPGIVEYLRSLNKRNIVADISVSEFLVTLLMESQRYYDFHQLLQYHIFNDHINIADRLLALSAQYPAAYQLGLDMLYRLNAHARILSLLLQSHQVLSALRLVSYRSSLFAEKGLAPANFLESALSTNDKGVFYATYKFFEGRNLAIRQSPAFGPEDHRCQVYVEAFEAMFGVNPNQANVEYVEEESEDEVEISLPDPEDEEDFKPANTRKQNGNLDVVVSDEPRESAELLRQQWDEERRKEGEERQREEEEMLRRNSSQVVQ